MSDDTTTRDRSPWERRDEESTRNYDRFRTYRDLGPDRTVRKTWEKITANATRPIRLTSLEQIAHTWEWRQRADAWDRHQADDEDEHLARERRRARLDNLALARLVLEKCRKGLETIDLVDAPADIARLIRAGIDLQKSAFGPPERSQRVTVSGPDGGPIDVADLSTLTPGDRAARLRELYESLEERMADTGYP